MPSWNMNIPFTLMLDINKHLYILISLNIDQRN